MATFASNPAMSALTGAEIIPGIQGAADARTTTQDIANLSRGTKGADIASAATPDLGAANGNYVHVTGTTTITGLGTVAAGVARVVVFDGALLLTHNATSLILPTGANITTAAGDTAVFVSEGAGNWRCVSYQRKDGTALAGSGGGGAVTSVNGATGAVVLTIGTLASVQSVTSAATVTPVATNDKVLISNQAVGLTIANPSGTAAEGQGFVIALYTAAAQSLTFDSAYRAMGAALPTTTVAGKWLYIPVIYNSISSTWDVLPVSQQL